MTLHDYITTNKNRYATFAQAITPQYTEWTQLWARAAFAVLSANVNFDRAVAALQYATTCRGQADPFVLSALSHTPDKARYLNQLPRGTDIFALLRGTEESWDHYREGLRKTVLGLGRTKASFCAGLFYPLEADLACIDTHMERRYLGYGAFRTLPRAEYLAVEAKVRRIARRHKISTFLAQWMIWDYQRGSETSHDIFPGRHRT